jgi:hypothetical protein
VLASTVAVIGHVAVFVVAVQVTGTELPVGRLLPLALVVLLASAVPANIRWGPREGAAAWAFGAVGLSAAEGVTVAVVYGVLTLVATLPGAVILVAGRGRRRDGTCELTGHRRGESGASYMPERPYTLLSCGMSIDGYIDTATDERLVLSNDADLDRTVSTGTEAKHDASARGDDQYPGHAAAAVR